MGEKFRSRSLKFPGLISGCTMDWFQRWPKDALIAVSTHFLAEYPIVCTDNVKTAVMGTMGEFQVHIFLVKGSFTLTNIDTLISLATFNGSLSRP